MNSHNPLKNVTIGTIAWLLTICLVFVFRELDLVPRTVTFIGLELQGLTLNIIWFALIVINVMLIAVFLDRVIIRDELIIDHNNFELIGASLRRDSSAALREIERAKSDLYEQFTEEKLSELIKKEISEKSIGKLIETTDRAVWDKYLDQKVEAEITAIRDNLIEWLETTRKSAALHFGLGVLLFVVGIGFANVFVGEFYSEVKLLNDELLRDVLFDLFPRLFLFLAIQVFAFHFFRLHRAGETTARNIRNEINTIRFKVLAFYAAMRTGPEQFQADVIKEFLHVERQKTLEIGQTTENLEREKLDHAGLEQSLNELSNQLKILSDRFQSMDKD